MTSRDEWQDEVRDFWNQLFDILGRSRIMATLEEVQAQIADLQGDTQGLSDAVGQAVSGIAELKTEVTALKDQVAALEAAGAPDLSGISEQIAQIDSTVERLQGELEMGSGGGEEVPPEGV
jgi:archaellum component FlaC